MARLNSRLANRRAGGPVAQPTGREPMATGASASAAVTLATSWPIGTVRVGEHDQLTLGLEHAGAHPKALSMIGLAADDPNPIVLRDRDDSEGLIDDDRHPRPRPRPHRVPATAGR